MLMAVKKNICFRALKEAYLPFILLLCHLICSSYVKATTASNHEGLPLFYWQEGNFVNFGDKLSLKLVERIVGTPLRTYNKKSPLQDKKLLAIGSIIYFANNFDVIWGSGINGKRVDKKDYNFSYLDVRSVRGPITRNFLIENFGIPCPEIFGDPALLLPYLFPEFKKSTYPQREYVIIPHYADIKYFPKTKDKHVVYPTEQWDSVISAILDSSFVISSSLHGIIVAEAFGIPARMLRVSQTEPLLKYQDYYEGTGRPDFAFATSVEEALLMGGEPPYQCDLQKLYNAFPFEFWTQGNIFTPNFSGLQK